MFCRNCGNEIQENTMYCPKCGAHVDTHVTEIYAQNAYKEQTPANRNAAENSKAPLRRSRCAFLLGIVAAVLAVALILQNLSVIPSFSSGSTATESHGYGTPEEVAEAFATAIANNDLDAALSLFAADLMAENYDFAGYINRTRVWHPDSQMPYPSTDTLYGEINRYMVKDRTVRQIGNMIFSLEGNNEYMQSLPVTYADRDLTLIISDMMNSCNIDNLSSFEFIRMDLSNPEAQLSEMNQENFTRSIQVYGADEQAEYTVLYSYSGETYAGGMTLIRYGNEWYIEFLSATLAGQPSTGYLTKMSESEYMERITSEELYSIYDRR